MFTEISFHNARLVELGQEALLVLEKKGKKGEDAGRGIEVVLSAQLKLLWRMIVCNVNTVYRREMLNNGYMNPTTHAGCRLAFYLTYKSSCNINIY